MMQKYERTLEEATMAEIKVFQEIVKKEVMAVIFLNGADKVHYGSLTRTLAQNMSMGINQYPRSTKDALNILNTYSQITKYEYKGKIYKPEQGRAEIAFIRVGMDQG